jgi:ribonuclease Y
VDASTVLIAVFGAVILGVLLVMLRLLLRSGRGHSAAATRGHESPLTAGGAGSPATSDADAAMLRQAELHAESLRATAQLAADEMRERADLSAEHARSLQAQAETEVQAVREQRADLERRERRLGEREERLDAEARTLEDRALELGELEQELDRKKAELLDIEADRRASLERVAGLTAERARAELIATIENDAKLRGAIIARDIEREARETGEARARRILTTVIQRLASEQTAESVVSVLHLPGDEMKGRIIGREGRNIRAFEQITGVNLIIDDTPRRCCSAASTRFAAKPPAWRCRSWYSTAGSIRVGSRRRTSAARRRSSDSASGPARMPWWRSASPRCIRSSCTRWASFATGRRTGRTC